MTNYKAIIRRTETPRDFVSLALDSMLGRRVLHCFWYQRALRQPILVLHQAKTGFSAHRTPRDIRFSRRTLRDIKQSFGRPQVAPIKTRG
jgi:hypothetical protein